MTQPIIPSQLERNPSMCLRSNPAQDLQDNIDFDRRTPKERFFDKITVVNSKSFLPQIPNLSSQSSQCLVGASSPSQEVFYFGRENTVNANVELFVLASVNGSDFLNCSASVNGLASLNSASEPSQAQSAASVHSLEHSSVSRQELESVPISQTRCTSGFSLERSISRQESNSVVSVRSNVQEVTDAQGTSKPIKASHDKEVDDNKAAPCLTASQINNVKKRRKSGKKKHKSTTGHPNFRSISQRSKDRGQKLRSITVDKNLTQNNNTANCNQDSKVQIKLKLSSGSKKRVTNIGAAYSVNTDPPMGQRVSQVIKAQDGAKDRQDSQDQLNLLALYSQPIQVSQKQKQMKKTVTLPTPIFAPKPPKTRNNVPLNSEICVDVLTRRQSVGASVDVGDYIPYRPAEAQYAATRGLVRVYLSERQSGTIKLHGQLHPGAPPATPTPSQLGHVVYIPSLNDIKAQRELKTRLEVLDRQEKKRQEKQIEENLRKEMDVQKETVKALKTMQRLQIYALNEVMTTLENERFEKFKQQKEKHSEKDLNDNR